jgi:hypothetical protein
VTLVLFVVASQIIYRRIYVCVVVVGPIVFYARNQKPVEDLTCAIAGLLAFHSQSTKNKSDSNFGERHFKSKYAVQRFIRALPSNYKMACIDLCVHLCIFWKHKFATMDA